MKCCLAPVAVVAAIVLASCGSSSTLSSDQYSGLQAQGKQFASSFRAIEVDASACAAKRKVGSTGALDNLNSCLVAALGKAQTGLGRIASYAEKLSGQVDGSCSTELKALSAATTDVQASFAKAETEARKGDRAAMQSTLTSIKATEITSSGSAAEKACKG